ncbi:hypothetical protein D3C71_1450780 [compost metagenome]
MAFGLENLVVVDLAELADGTICGQGQPVGVADDRAGAVTQRAYKEFVEAGVGAQLWMLGLLHVYAVITGKALQNQLGQPTGLLVRTPARQAGQSQLR